ncbi:hypothetical protein BD410DRAFT_796241 [Rickenella mellea]|uniref:Uncharacterized protein n=1 Tax=Rickenella mellea TaxID=50990 RepID=A0A4Y7PLA7_9AGAM|nr:hypothetical protein BD410DRAFT_796241 [Rickenella mellea]
MKITIPLAGRPGERQDKDAGRDMEMGGVRRELAVVHTHCLSICLFVGMMGYLGVRPGSFDDERRSVCLVGAGGSIWYGEREIYKF